ncbi:MAG: hypothetical protein JWO31_3250 [Phycisphaerales bacterium]|nr:hypothetical protein [Phycisphaerales bacterium]
MPTDPDVPTEIGTPYLDVSAATALAALLPGLAAFKAAAEAEQATALALATSDIDAAMPYQGCRADPDQHREFPRADDDGAEVPAGVPDAVRLATLHQADSILAGVREPRLDAQHDGVVYALDTPRAESYKATPGPGVPTGLCRRAWALVRRYRLRGGRLA